MMHPAILGLLGLGGLCLLNNPGGLGRTGYVPSGGRATASRARANLSMSRSQQRNVHTAQRMRPGQTSAWSLPKYQPTFKPSGYSRSRFTPRPIVYQSAPPRTPPKSPTPTSPPPPPTSPPKAPAPRTQPRPAPPPPKAPAPTGPKASGDWYNQMRKNMMTQFTSNAPKKAPASAPAPKKEGFKINPIIAAGAAALVPIFGAMT